MSYVYYGTDFPFLVFADDNDKSTTINGKKIKELRVLDAKSAQNLAILLGGSLKHMTFEEVKISILRCDEEVMSANLIEQLINYLPPPDQLKRLEDLQQVYEELSDAEQFAVTVIFLLLFWTKNIDQNF